MSNAKALFAGLSCLPGQLDLFETNGEQEPLAFRPRWFTLGRYYSLHLRLDPGQRTCSGDRVLMGSGKLVRTVTAGTCQRGSEKWLIEARCHDGRACWGWVYVEDLLPALGVDSFPEPLPRSFVGGDA